MIEDPSKMQQGQKAAPDVPEEILAGGLSEVIRYIQETRNVQSIGLRRYMVEPAERERAGARTDLPEGSTTTMEANAITAKIIESIWPRIFEWTSAHPGKLAQGGGADPSKLAEMNEALLTRKFTYDPIGGFRELRAGTLSLTQHFTALECHQRTQQGDHALARLSSILQNPMYHAYSHEPRLMIEAGFVTAADTVWSLLASVPSAYRKQYRREIDAESYAQLAPSVKRIVRNIAGSSIHALMAIRKVIENESYQIFQARLEVRGLEIQETNGKPAVGFDREILRAIAQNLYETRVRPTVRTGCPALAVQGPESSNVVNEYFDWCYSLVEKYYLPTLDQRPKA